MKRIFCGVLVILVVFYAGIVFTNNRIAAITRAGESMDSPPAKIARFRRETHVIFE